MHSVVRHCHSELANLTFGVKMEQITISFFGTIRRAIRRARTQITVVAIVYILSILTGSVMVHQGNKFALDYRDKIVGQAQSNDPAAIAYKEGKAVKAALFDFERNLLLGAVPQTITGLTVISPYGFAAYRGWIGGIVSVNRQHESRLADKKQAIYFFITLILQLIPYTLAGGIGIKLGMTYFKQYPEYQDQKRWLGYPLEALRDVARVYVLIVPLFFIASLWEFLSPWN
jgi:hypothetical protein